MALAVLSCACSRRPRAAEVLLPQTISRIWTRVGRIRDVPPPQPNVARLLEAGYEGAGKVTVDLYETKASGTAFEMTQHWRAAPNTVFFDKGRYFVVVKWEQADRNALTAFVRALQKELGDLEK